MAPRLALSALSPAQAGQGSGIVNACAFLGGSGGVAGGAIAFASGGFVGVRGSGRGETNEEWRERRQFEWAFGGAFHNYAMQYPYIAIPNYANALNQYRLDIGYRLFEKYDWAVGERDCSGVLPLDQWEPEDRAALIDLYQRANPECSSNAPPGWKCKFDRRARF